MKLEFIVDQEYTTVVDFLRRKQISRRMIRFIKQQGEIYINGILSVHYNKVYPFDKVEVLWKEEVSINSTDSLDLEILFEDETILAVHKSTHMPMHSSKKHQSNTLSTKISAYFKEKDIQAQVHFINRLDAATSGIVLVAKNRYIHSLFGNQNVDIHKEYLAKIEGILEKKEDTLTFKISREEAPSIIRYVSNLGKEATTKYKVLQEDGNSSILQVRIFTGRTHQIRVHLSHISHPILGDLLYGNPGENLYLHCYYISFVHPVTKEAVEIINKPKWYMEEIACQI